MRPTPYVGISGVMSAAEVEVITTTFRPHNLPRKLAFGALVSSKTIDGGTNKYPKRYPHIDDIAGVFAKRDVFGRSLFLVHYSTSDDTTLDRDIERAYMAGGPYCDGVQINCRWPDVDKVRSFARMFSRVRVVLQVKPNEPVEAILLRTHMYAYAVTDVLVDGSGGRGAGLDVLRVAHLLSALRHAFPHLGLGFAGGLCTATLPTIKELFQAMPDLSIDAEGRLRDVDDRLRCDESIAYAALAMGYVSGE